MLIPKNSLRFKRIVFTNVMKGGGSINIVPLNVMEGGGGILIMYKYGSINLN